MNWSPHLLYRGALVALLVAALLPLTGFAQRPRRQFDRADRPRADRVDRPRRAPNRGAMLARALRKLKLSQEQQRNLRAIHGRSDVRFREYGRKIIDGRRRVEEMLAGDRASIARARTEATDLSRLLGERTQARTLAELELFTALTKEQRAELRRMRDEARNWKADRGDRRGMQGRRARPRRDMAPGGARRDAEPRRLRGRELLDRLNLTPEQFEQLRRMRRERGMAMRDLGNRYREAQRAVDDALLADEVDRALVERLAAELGRVEAEREMLRFEVEADMRSILTPEQAALLRESRRQQAPADEVAEPDDADEPDDDF